MKNNEKRYTCPVCGYNELKNELYDKDGFGTYEICVCCGFEFGNDDFPDKEKAFIDYRKRWIENGYQWFSKSTQKPKHWNGKTQVEDYLNSLNKIQE